MTTEARTVSEGYIVGCQTVLSRDPHSTRRKRWLCRCSCGAVASVREEFLRVGTPRYCRFCHGSYREGSIQNTVLRNLWRLRLADVIQRCSNPKRPGYKHYGGRGIRVHSAWLMDHHLFLMYIQTLPGWDDPTLELDRIDNNGNYEPGNLRLATRQQQNSNTRKTVWIEHEGIRYTAKEFWRHFCPQFRSPNPVIRAIRRGVSAERIIQTPNPRTARSHKRKKVPDV